MFIHFKFIPNPLEVGSIPHGLFLLVFFIIILFCGIYTQISKVDRPNAQLFFFYSFIFEKVSYKKICSHKDMKMICH